MRASALRGLLPLLAAALLAGREAVAADAARDAATNFYRGYAKLRAAGGLSGLPDRRQFAHLSPLLAAELRGLLVAARKEQERCAKQRPGDKPPWVEGDLFSSQFEGFTSFRVAASKAAGRRGGRVATVRFRHAEGKSSVEWSDDLLLRNEAGRWRVADVVYRAKFPFTGGYGTRLTEALRRVPAC